MKHHFGFCQFTVFLLVLLVSSDLHSITTETKELKKGGFQIIATVSELSSYLSVDTQKSYASIIDSNEKIEWEVYVPQHYQANKKPGLMVYISPTRNGKIPKKWMTLMDKYNLIWVAANRSGNNIDPRKRMTMAILATTVINNNYPVDINRVYVSGLSGGGRMASITASIYPQLFKGAIYNCGVNYWKNLSTESVETIKGNRFVFISGRKDFNLEDTKKVFRKYKKAGVENSKLLINPTMGHENPNKKDFETAIKFLDGN